MPRKKVAKRKDPPTFRPELLAALATRGDARPVLEKEEPKSSGQKPKMKTVFGQTLAKMDPADLKAQLDEILAASLVPKEPIDRTIFKRLERKTRQWEQPFGADDVPGWTAPKKTDERPIKRYRRSLAAIILDEATEDDASLPTPELQHQPDSSIDPTAKAKSIFEQAQGTDPEDLVVVGSSRDRA